MSLRSLFLSVFVLVSSGLSASVFASDTKEILYTGQKTETVELRDILTTGGTWGASEETEVRARVTIEFGAAPEGVVPEEKFVVELDEDSLSVVLKSSGKVLVSQEAPEIRMDRASDLLTIDAKYRYSFLDIAPVVEVLSIGLTNAEVRNESLFFEAAPDFFEKGFMLRLSVSEKRILRRGELVFDQPVSSTSLKRIPTEDGKILYSTSLATLGLPVLGPGAYVFDFFGSFDSGSASIVNASDLPRKGRLHVKTVVKMNLSRR